uniref:Putative secreted protein n=1 Tax=Anopheles triannulatus TaxID=58253 RepID=A0A2M4B6N0_9DIPT
MKISLFTLELAIHCLASTIQKDSLAARSPQSSMPVETRRRKEPIHQRPMLCLKQMAKRMITSVPTPKRRTLTQLL